MSEQFSNLTGNRRNGYNIQRRSYIYAVMPWRAHRQVKKK